MEAELKEQVERLRLRDSVTVTGRAIKQEEIPEFMGTGDVYALPCVWASDNDVDGLPQMLMEAMACGLPVVSTRLVGIPDLVHHEKTGLLVEPNDAHQLADALQRLAEEPGLGEQLAAAGRQQVLESFDIATSLEPLVRRYRAHLDRHGDDFGAAR
jgi:glycosyltransferase involved in cell wall biosynthesis